MFSIEQRVSEQGGARVHVAALVIRAVVPEKVVGGDGLSIQLFHADLGRVDKEIIQGDQIIPAAQAVIIANEGVIVEMDALRDAGSSVILQGHTIVHQAQPGHCIGLNEVALDEKEAVRHVGIVDELNPIFTIVGDGVAPDDDVQGRTAILVKPDLDPVVAVVAHGIVLDDRFAGAVQVHGVIAVILEDIVAAGAATVFVVNSIDVANEPVVENVELGRGADAIFTVLDGEADDLGLGADRCHDGDHSGAISVDDSLVDETGVRGGVKQRSEGDGLALDGECFVIDAGGN